MEASVRKTLLFFYYIYINLHGYKVATPLYKKLRFKKLYKYIIIFCRLDLIYLVS